MFPFSQSVNPALRSHLDTQLAFFNELSQSLSGSFQNICAANLKLSQNVLEETLSTSRRMLNTENAHDVIGSASAGVQPISAHLLAYRQHVSRLAAGAQVDLARVTQQHGEEASRTAHALADEVSRVAVEETDRNTRQQEEFVKNFRDPFQPEDTHAAASGRAAGDTVAGASKQSEGRPANGASSGFPQAQPANDKQPGKRN